MAGKESYHRDLIELARAGRDRARAAAVARVPPRRRRLRRRQAPGDRRAHHAAPAADRGRPQRARRRPRGPGAGPDLRPQNLGTILRSAAFFGVDALLVMKNRAAEVSPLVARVAVGGAELVQIFRVTNLARSLEILKGLGFWIYGLDERGRAHAGPDRVRRARPCWSSAPRARACATAPSSCATRWSGSPAARTGLESLNAGVATAVALAEVFRGRDAGDGPSRAGPGACRLGDRVRRRRARRARRTCPSGCRPAPGRRC